MTSSKFAQLLQNELILPRDPHLVARFEALLAENFLVDPEEVPIVVEPQLKPVEEWTRDGLLVRRDAPEVNASLPADGVNIVPQYLEKPDYSTLPLGSVVGRDNPAFAGQKPSIADEETHAIPESEAK